MNYTYNATIQPFIDRGIILIYSAIKGSIDNAKKLIHIGLMSDSLFTGWLDTFYNMSVIPCFNTDRLIIIVYQDKPLELYLTSLHLGLGRF